MISPNGRPVKTSSQVWSYFDPGSEAASRHLLSDWLYVQTCTMGQCEQHEDDVKSHQQSPKLCLPKLL